MRIVTNEEMSKIDTRIQRYYRVPGAVLMENAGRGAADVLAGYYDPWGLKVLVVCGRGNNGGDGFVIARHLKNRGSDVKIFLLGRKKDLDGDALRNFVAVEQDGLEIVESVQFPKFNALLSAFEPECIVDAIFGTGFRGEPEGVFYRVIEAINAADVFVLAVDIPSGVNGDTGRFEKTCVIADATAVMGLPKRGNYLYPGREYCGKLHLVDIGIPEALISDGYPRLIGYEFIKSRLPYRPPDGNKGTFGQVLMVGGARGYSGAAVLAARSAIRSGAGLVRIAVPRGIIGVLENNVLEAVKVALPETPTGTINAAAGEILLPLLDRSDILVIGPGLTTHPETVRFLCGFLPRVRLPMVIDADAINILARFPGVLKKIKAPFIMTPHPGEFSRLVKLPIREINDRRVDLAAHYARKLGGVIVLKGAPTVIASPRGETYINPTGNSGLASAGTGDVLVGMIAGFLAQSRLPLEAALCGVFLHGLAADRALGHSNEYSLSAGDLVDWIPDALNYVLHESYRDGKDETEECQ